MGLDPSLDRLPTHLLSEQNSRSHINEVLFTFCCAIVDSTHRFVCAFKPQFAHFAALGAESALERVIDYIHSEYPDIPVILDAKRGDVASTAERYADEAFIRYEADAVTVNPYLGWDSIEPYTRHQGKGVVILCHTSNPDGSWMQEYPDADPVYMRVARMASERDEGNLMLVIGATFPQLLCQVRAQVPSIPFLVPGIGTQGGDLEAVVSGGRSDDGRGLVINASRSVIFAGTGEDFADAAAAVARGLAQQMPVTT